MAKETLEYTVDWTTELKPDVPVVSASTFPAAIREQHCINKGDTLCPTKCKNCGYFELLGSHVSYGQIAA
jgi:hypothetical protein